MSKWTLGNPLEFRETPRESALPELYQVTAHLDPGNDHYLTGVRFRQTAIKDRLNRGLRGPLESKIHEGHDFLCYPLE